ncbi:MAG: DNA-directed RNA polymerase subunit beta [Tissierellia bacterium]|nr:DNA-directed RNA polymerase subunit beta [Tissierellia bacterium]
MPQLVKFGDVERLSFARIDQRIELPDFLEIQTKSFQWFREKGLKEALDDISPIYDYTGKILMEFVDYYFEEEPKYSVQECKDRDVSYSVALRVEVRLINKETGEIKKQNVFMGDFPLMTSKGTFIINGAERVIVSQLVRSPSTYFTRKIDKSGNEMFSGQVIPNRGAWLEFETDSAESLSVRIDRTRKLPVTALVRMLGYESNEAILEFFGESERLLKTLEKDSSTSREEGYIEIYRKLRPGEPPTIESASALIDSMFFDDRRYDLARVGRYKFNQNLDLFQRATGQTLMEDAIDPLTGEILYEAGTLLNKKNLRHIENAGIKRIVLDVEEERVVVISNHMVDIDYYISGVDKDIIGERVHYPTLMDILEKFEDHEDRLEQIHERVDELIPRHITVDDMLASCSYFFNLSQGVGETDDIDHLSNRRIRSVGELLQNQFRIGLSRMERVIRERMTTQDADTITPQTLINIRPVTAAIKEFFGSSQLSQFMDQNNPLAELTHKRRLSALGPGGLSRDRAGFEVRDVHYSHYGRMCPIETPEGPNIGLISYLATYGRINEYGFIESPYRVVEPGTGRVTDEIVYLNANEERHQVIVPANEPLDEKGNIIADRIIVRYDSEIKEVSSKTCTYMEVSPQQMVSVATALIPFLENDDSVRALMGSNMQKQAVPLLRPQSPVVGTGMEYKSAYDSGSLILAEHDGEVIKATGDEVIVRRASDGSLDKYELLKFKRSNQGTSIHQKVVASKGQMVKAGDLLCDGPATDLGEMALGSNILVGFMTWEGYNFEDAILISEELVEKDVLTSIHIEEYESEARDTKLGPEEITRDIPNVGEDALKDLDYRGIVRIGAEVDSGDILVGKVTPKGETELTPEERLLRAIFGKKAREVRDTSLTVPHGASGIVVDVKLFSRENGDEMTPGVNELVRVYIAKKRKINVGDKMAGRHGNKGVISRILPKEDMPFLDDGRPLQILLSPLGVPSRMNVGQVLEVHLGLAANQLGLKVATPVFDGANESQIEDLLEEAGFPRDGKLRLRDGRTGDYFDQSVTVGYMYLLKLHHLVDDKIHARSTGPYSLVTQQPLGGKAQFGGQRFGEMEVWALEAYGAAYTLQEVLTIKSDDVMGRVKAYEAIVKGEDIPSPGIPESFKVLIKEFQSLALDVKVLDEDGKEINLELEDDYEVSGDTQELIAGSHTKEEYDMDSLDDMQEVDLEYPDTDEFDDSEEE